MDLGISGRKAIVCASSKGLGRACAEALAEACCELVVNGRSGEELASAANEIRGRTGVVIREVVGDLNDPATRAALIAAAGRHEDPRQRQPAQRALSHEHTGKIEAQLKAEVADLMAKAEAADAADIPDGMSIPDELARREERLRKLAEAREKIEAQAKERHAREQAEHEARLAARQAKAEASGKKPGGRPPEPPVEGPRPNDQINLTDEESRIMPVAGGGFDQCYNAQAAVAAGSLLVVASAVSQAPNDKQQLEPMLDKIEALAEELGKPERLLADTGYFSAANVAACEKAGIEPMIAMGRQPHHLPLAERFEATPEAPQHPTPVEAMAHRLKTPAGRALYALRKQMPEPVFGIIKSALGFRQFSLRGLAGARGEWSLVTVAWNIKRLSTLVPA